MTENAVMTERPAVAEQPGVPDDTTPASGRSFASLAARLGCTEGQLYSMAIAITASSVLVLGGGVPLGGAEKLAAAPTTAPAPAVAVAPAPTSSSPLAPPVVAALPPLQAGTGAPPAPFVPAEVVDDGLSTAPAPWQPGPSSPRDFRVPRPGAPRALTGDGTRIFTGTDNSKDGPSHLISFSRTGDPSKSFSIRGQQDDRTGGLSAAAMHGATVLVTDRSRGVLLELDPRTGQQKLLATLPDLPPCIIGVAGTCQPGPEDLAPSPEGLVATGDHAYVGDAAQGTIWRYTFATKQLTAWYTSSDFSSGGPSGLARDAKGALVFTVAESADPAALLRGALYRIDVATDGSAGTRTLLATFTPEAGVGSVVVGRSSIVYVALRSAGGVVMIKPDGTVTPMASAPQVPAPGGLSLVDGTLFVADAGKPATASSGIVRGLTVMDTPA